MMKEHERREYLKTLDEEKRHQEESKYEAMKKKHGDHPRVNHPVRTSLLVDIPCSENALVIMLIHFYVQWRITWYSAWGNPAGILCCCLLPQRCLHLSISLTWSPWKQPMALVLACLHEEAKSDIRVARRVLLSLFPPQHPFPETSLESRSSGNLPHRKPQ